MRRTHRPPSSSCLHQQWAHGSLSSWTPSTILDKKRGVDETTIRTGDQFNSSWIDSNSNSRRLKPTFFAGLQAACILGIVAPANDWMTDSYELYKTKRDKKRGSFHWHCNAVHRRVTLCSIVNVNVNDSWLTSCCDVVPPPTWFSACVTNSDLVCGAIANVHSMWQ
jgi:hypothetical protein